MGKRLIWILWPSFIVAGIAEIIFFTLIDPQELYLLGEPVTYSRLATYTIGFFCFWALTAGSSMLTCFFQRPAADINRREGSTPRSISEAAKTGRKTTTV